MAPHLVKSSFKHQTHCICVVCWPVGHNGKSPSQTSPHTPVCIILNMPLLGSVHSVPQSWSNWIILIFHLNFSTTGDGTEATTRCNQGHSVCIIQIQKCQRARKNTQVSTFPSLVAGFNMSKYKLCNSTYPQKKQQKKKSPIKSVDFSSPFTCSSTHGEAQQVHLKATCWNSNLVF